MSARTTRSTFRGGLASGMVHLARTAAQVAMAVVLARLLGPEGYGEYAFALVIVMLLQAPVQSGVTNVAVRFTSVYQDCRQWRLLLGLSRRLPRWACLYSLVAAAIFVAVVVPYGNHFGHAVSRPVLLAAAGVLMLLPFPALFGGILRGLGMPVLGQLPQYVLYPTLLLTLLLVAAATGHAFPPWQAMALNAAVCLVVALFAGWWASREMPAATRSVNKPEYENNAWRSAIIPLTFTGGMVVINNQAGVFFVGILSGASQAGIYRAASQGAYLVSLGLMAIGLLTAPEIAKLHARGQRRALQSLVTAGARFAALGAAVVTVIYFAFGRQVLTAVFGDEFAAGYAVLVILSAGGVINAASGLVGNILNMSGHERDSMAGFSIAAALNVTFNLILTPAYGATGAALAGASSMALWNAFLIVRTYQRTGLNSTIFSATH